ncbi:RNA polymerase sigma-70 factor [Sunxiuqinia sp. A32]|uniref:RNA polymerase sigma-70 factor n=1 Tax=Sunxiuqinia sp. A32 TaxID=3461496 RepID=UPI0040458BA6
MNQLLRNRELHLFAEMKAGNKESFNYFFDYYYSGLCIYAKNYIGDLSASEEVVQDVFVRFWEKRQNIKIESSVRFYLYKTVYNQCLNLLKHKKIERNYRQNYLIQQNNLFEEQWSLYNESELRHVLNQAMSKLPPRCREVFELSRFENLKNKEIAEKLEITEKTVENQITKALKVLRKELKDFLPLFLMYLS